MLSFIKKKKKQNCNILDFFFFCLVLSCDVSPCSPPQSQCATIPPLDSILYCIYFNVLCIFIPGIALNRE